MVTILNKKIPVINVLVLIIFSLLFLIVTLKYAPEIIQIVSKPEKLSEHLQSYGYSGVFVFISIQVLQVIIAAIPGEFVQIAGGYIYGAWLGSFYLLIGAIIGSIVVFYISRLLGYPLVKAFVPEDKLTKFIRLMGSKKSDIVVFFLFLVPGVPKDILTYIAGLTPVKPMRFIIIAVTARLPALFVSAYIGANLQERNYVSVIVLSSIAVILFVLGLLFKDRAIESLHKRTHKRRQNERS